LSPASTAALSKRQATGALLHNVNAMPQRTGAEVLFGSQAYKPMFGAESLVRVWMS